MLLVVLCWLCPWRIVCNFYIKQFGFHNKQVIFLASYFSVWLYFWYLFFERVNFVFVLRGEALQPHIWSITNQILRPLIHPFLVPLQAYGTRSTHLSFFFSQTYISPIYSLFNSHHLFFLSLYPKFLSPLDLYSTLSLTCILWFFP